MPVFSGLPLKRMRDSPLGGGGSRAVTEVSASQQRSALTRDAEGKLDITKQGINEDLALAFLLQAVSSRIDPTGELYGKLCSSFNLSELPIREKPYSAGGQRTEGGSHRLEEISSPHPAAAANDNTEDGPKSEQADGTKPTERPVWGVGAPDPVQELCDMQTLGAREYSPSLPDCLLRLKALGCSDLLRRIQDRVVASIPSAVITQRFRPLKWRLGPELGKGAFGECRMALCEDSGALFAVKSIPLNGPTATVAATVGSVKRELEVLRGVSHPHIVDMYAVSLATQTPAALCDFDRGEDIGNRGGTGVQEEDVGSLDTSPAPDSDAAADDAGLNTTGASGSGTEKDLVLNIAMEYMEGGSLAKQIEDFGPLPESVVASYARQICLGLEYLHALNVVHADIKPANCLLDKSGLLKLSDFGCAQRLERHKHAHSTPPHSDPRACKASECFGQKGELGLEVVSSRAELDKLNDDELSDGASAAIGALVCVQGRAQMGRAIGKGQGSGIRYLMPEGTPNYMPPEVVRAREYSEKSDVWALGLSILECLTGLRGYPYTNPQTTLFQVGLGTAPDMPDWLGSEASSFIRACLQPNPRDRPTAAELLEHPFLLRSGCATLGPLGGGGRAGTDGRRDRQGARRAPPGVRAAEVPTALLQLLASLNAHTGGALQATSEAHRVCDDDKWVGSMVPIRGRSGEGRKATIEELESPTASRDGLRESGV